MSPDRTRLRGSYVQLAGHAPDGCGVCVQLAGHTRDGRSVYVQPDGRAWDGHGAYVQLAGHAWDGHGVHVQLAGHPLDTAVTRFRSTRTFSAQLDPRPADAAPVGCVGFVRDPFGTVDFVPLGPWNGDATGEVLAVFVERLRRRGVVAFDEGHEELAAPLDDLRAASLAHRIALGPRRGQRVERVGAREARRPRDVVIAEGQRKARLAGFDLEAGTRIAAWDRRGLERLARPDGSTHLALTPVELVETWSQSTRTA